MDRTEAERDSIESLAVQLYNTSNSTNVPWVRRDRTIQDRWRKAAREKLGSAAADRVPDGAE